MGALNALVERAKSKLAADAGLARARYVVPLVCERAAVDPNAAGDVTFNVWEQLDVTVSRQGVELVVHGKQTSITFDVDLAPLIAAAREELSPPAWDGAGETKMYLDDTRKLLEERARKLIDAG